MALHLAHGRVDLVIRMAQVALDMDFTGAGTATLSYGAWLETVITVQPILETPLSSITSRPPASATLATMGMAAGATRGRIFLSGPRPNPPPTGLE